MFAVDIASFGSRHDPAVQRHLRSSIHRIVRESCQAVGLSWDACYSEDRGDGLFVIAGPEAGIDDLLGPLAIQLLGGVRRHNRLANREAQIRLRVAVNAGYIQFDDHGATGVALNHLFRLLDAAPLKYKLAEVSGDFALIVSHRLFEEVVVHSVGVIEPSSFMCVPVKVKETHDRGWVWMPPASGSVRSGLDAEVVASDERLLGLLAALVRQLDELVQRRV
ncbi:MULTISPECIES: hypothetical protein [unclassified Spirillospora]|uniref:hypothetical protein n=1 Tax=unclassified Spirillospora TaxID=2642701 RepID=UPI003723D0B2